ncbi:zinc finger protein 142-like [Aricia agestis]|uniref:zinc finger protein 142-like n=1 Tax=Aricia agestis TaxID=91739 RepID=UPI001C204A09|nr:zinc finger protein 142-like [Aricia agestis]
MSVAPAVKREHECGGGGGSPGRKRRKQAAPARAHPPPPIDLHAKMADIYKSALAFGELALPTFDPLAAFRLLPRHDPPRIFNPEAYCDLCCKEFCNKYFLKTHRANKHGIYDGDQQQQQQQQQQQHLGVPPPPATPPRRSSDEESGGTPRRLSPDSARRARESAFQPDVLRRLGVTNPEAFCEICCKEYCNKYFLRTHRERRHGVPALRSPERLPEPSPVPATPPSAPPRSITPPEPTPPLALPPALPYDDDRLPVKREHEERDDFEAALRDSQTSPLNLIMEERTVGSPGSASEELRKLQTMISQLNELAAERLAEEPADAPRPQSDSPPQQDDRRSSGGAAGSSFCEICNKELCNKYFMRTHMQRMHGISLESGTQLGGVTCDICHKELCSKYFLRVHKHNTHGIPAPPAPATAAPAEACPLCARRFRGPRALRAHLLAEHAPPARPPPPPPAPPRPLDLLARDKPYACSYCPFTTDVLAFLFAHERAHVQRAAEQAELAEGEGESGAEASEAGEGEGEADGDAYSCSRCEFRAESFAALEAHVRAAHGGAGALLAVPRAPRAPLTMQPFVLEEAGGALSLLPALVFLPVRRRATRRATVTLTLTPA